MGAFTSDQNPNDKAVQDTNASSVGMGKGEVETDVPEVYADDVIQKGNEQYYVFDVSQSEFYSNMSDDRKKLRFKNGSKVMQYKNKTKNSLRPFYIRCQNKNGQSFTRKIR